MPHLGDKIRIARQRRGITQSQLAQGLVTRSMMSQIESGKARPSYALLKSLTERLGVDVHDFMDDADTEMATKARLELLDYYLKVEDIDAATEVFQSLEKPSAHSSLLSEYLRLRETHHRKCGEIELAVQDLKEFHEIAYHIQDTYLQIQVHQESGYLEYAMNNADDAITEWKKAASLGEAMMRESRPSGVLNRIPRHLVDLYLALARVLRPLGRLQEAAEYLIKADEMARPMSDFRQISMLYAEEAEALMNDGEPRMAQLFARGASAILQAARSVQQSTLAHLLTAAWNTQVSEFQPSGTQLSGAPSSDAELLDSPIPDLLTLYANALYAATPRIALESELAYAEVLVTSGRHHEALPRVQSLCQTLRNMTHGRTSQEETSSEQIITEATDSGATRNETNNTEANSSEATSAEEAPSSLQSETPEISPGVANWACMLLVQATILLANIHAELDAPQTAITTMLPLLDRMESMTHHQIRRMFAKLLEWSEGSGSTEQAELIGQALNAWMDQSR